MRTTAATASLCRTRLRFRAVYGIDAYDCDFSRIDSNVVRGYDDGVEYGVRAHESAFVNIEYNDIQDFREYGIYFRNSANGIVNHNRVIGADNGGWMRGIDNEANDQFAQVNYNYVELLNTDGGGQTDKHGILVHDSEVIGDSVIVYINGQWRSNGTGIRADRSTIQDNYVRVEDHYYIEVTIGIESYGDGAPRHVISNNHIEATRESRGIWASYADIENNHLNNWSGNSNDDWAIGHGDYNVIRNNTIVGFQDGIYCDDRWDNVVEDNSIDTRHWGVYANNAKGDHRIEGNTFTKSNSEWLIYVTNAASVEVKHNECAATGGEGFYFNNTSVTMERNLIVTPGRGLELTNQAGGKVLNNTIVSTDGGETGVKVSNLSTPIIRNNIVQGFETGMQIDNDLMNTNVSHNGLWDISGEQYAGTALAPLIGENNSFNGNGDESDVYGNIYMDPLFVAPDSLDYHLSLESPCINAGDPSMQDPDGTVVDMGAYFSINFGCTDEEACNYSPNATEDDGSCQELDECEVCGGDGTSCLGCVYETACNYDETATIDDGSCVFYCAGCTDEMACNYDSEALQDDGSCLYLDAFGVCGGDCEADEDGDGLCDDEDDCVGEYDDCGICNGPGSIYECGCADIPEGDCDCEGNTLDVLGNCGGTIYIYMDPCLDVCRIYQEVVCGARRGGLSPEADEDGDGLCDDVDDCVGEYDDCGICNGPGSIYECGCADIPEGDCDCVFERTNTLDEALQDDGSCGLARVRLTKMATASATTKTTAWASTTTAAFATVPARSTSAAAQTSQRAIATAKAIRLMP